MGPDDEMAAEAERRLLETTEWVPLDLDKALRPPSGIIRTPGGLGGAAREGAFGGCGDEGGGRMKALMDAVMQFLAEGMQQAPVAVGVIAAFFLIYLPVMVVGEVRSRRESRAFRKRLDEITGPSSEEHAKWQQDRDARAQRYAPKNDHEEA